MQYIRGKADVIAPWFSAPILIPPVWQASIFSGNPYLPANVQQIMNTEGLQSFGFAITGDNQWEHPSPLGTYKIKQDDVTDTYTLGFNWNIADSGFLETWKLRGYTQYGKNHQQQHFLNGLRMDRLPIALDVVTNQANGQPACRAALANPAVFGNCVPVNLFGGTGSVSAAAASYLVDQEKIIDSVSKQHFTEIVLDGQLLQGWAGADPHGGRRLLPQG